MFGAIKHSMSNVDNDIVKACNDGLSQMRAEMHRSVRKMRTGRASGHDAVIAEMILDDGECLHDCMLQMYNRMLQGEFPQSCL